MHFSAKYLEMHPLVSSELTDEAPPSFESQYAIDSAAAALVPVPARYALRLKLTTLLPASVLRAKRSRASCQHRVVEDYQSEDKKRKCCAHFHDDSLQPAPVAGQEKNKVRFEKPSGTDW